MANEDDTSGKIALPGYHKEIKLQNVLLLNPPGDKKYFREYFCTKISKARYYYQQIDLVYLSGRFSSEKYRVYHLDCIADNLSVEASLQKVLDLKPDIVVSMIASPSFNQDMAFLKKVKESLPEVKIMATGDVARGLRGKLLERTPSIDIVFYNFANADPIVCLEEGKGQTIPNVSYRHDGKIIEGPEHYSPGVWNVPMPRLELFVSDRYSFPFGKKHKVASMLTDFGCAYTCSFCPIGTIGFRLRPIPDVIAEMKFLKSLGVRELFIQDQTFGVNKKRTKDLCDAMVKEGFDFSWTTFSRVDVIDEGLLKDIKRAGCHTIMFGVETTNDDVLEHYNKSTTFQNILHATKLCKKHHLSTVGTFIIGLPGEDKQSILRTIEQSISLKLDYASFNIATPRYGTPLREEAIEKKWIDPDLIEMESAKTMPIWKDQLLTNEELYALRKKAIKRFYLRPFYLFNRLIHIRSFFEFRNKIDEALALFK